MTQHQYLQRRVTSAIKPMPRLLEGCRTEVMHCSEDTDPPLPHQHQQPDAQQHQHSTPTPQFCQQQYFENNPCLPRTTKRYPLPPPFENGCRVQWTWNAADKSHEVRLCGRGQRTTLFHPNWSNGTAGVRGNRCLNGGVYYWEVRVSSRVFGTSMMFGIATSSARLHVDAFVNLLGEDEESWGLSHKGLVWHAGRARVYTTPFKENEATTIGVLFDGLEGTLSFYKDGVCLGPAFTGLENVRRDIYPVVCSTAAKTEMTLGARRRAYLSLQDRCRAAILASLDLHKIEHVVSRLPLPKPLRQYIRDQPCS